MHSLGAENIHNVVHMGGVRRLKYQQIFIATNNDIATLNEIRQAVKVPH